MKIQVLMMVVLALLCGSGSANETNEFVLPADYGVPSREKEVSWQRHACEICGKTIWEKVELTTTFSTGSGLIYWDNTYDFVVLGDDTPVRVTAENLHGETDYKVCPYCFGKYTRAFGETVRKAAKAFVDEAKAKESKRRAEVAQENTQEELRRVEGQLREYAEQVKQLKQKLEALKGQITTK